MSRLVRVPQRANENSALAGLEDVLGPHLSTGEASAEAPETYLERIAKYVPAEVLAFFIFINTILEQAGKTGGKGAAMAGLPVTTVAQGALVVGLLLTPLLNSQSDLVKKWFVCKRYRDVRNEDLRFLRPSTH